MKNLVDSRTKMTAIVFGMYNVAVAFFPQVAEMVSPDMVNSVLGALIAWFMRDGIKKVEK